MGNKLNDCCTTDLSLMHVNRCKSKIDYVLLSAKKYKILSKNSTCEISKCNKKYVDKQKFSKQQFQALKENNIFFCVNKQIEEGG